MELKYLRGEHVSMRKVSFNRTFMELKLIFTHKASNFLSVLIVPLWN